MLTLPIKKKWFDMIKSGEKKEEYREIKPYWTKRFLHNLDVSQFQITGAIDDKIVVYAKGTILLKNGYGIDKPTLKCKIEIKRTGFGKEEWGAEPNKLYYVLEILSVEEIK